jgi:ADP-ribosyl-[dinitrogen reductase] hydrolase
MEASLNSQGLTSKEVFEQLLGNGEFKRSVGCIVGAYVGDAAGSVIEFVRKEIDRDMIEEAFKFTGSKKFQISPGQITDDSEMAMCMLHGILQSHEKGKPSFDPMDTAEYYCKWYENNPRDIGNTTRSAMKAIKAMLENGDKIESLAKNFDDVNHTSNSNGCLMRATPMSVYCRKLPDDKIYDLTKADVNLTHLNPIWVQAVTCYNIAIAHLINNEGDAEGAIDRVDNYIKSNIDVNKEKTCKKLVEHWESIFKAKSEADLIEANNKGIGYVMIAFVYSFFYLKLELSYEEAVKRSLLLGGDTDTNAAIVGGMMGAYHGIDAIHVNWRNKVLNSHYDYPEFMRTVSKDDLYGLILELYQYSDKFN